MKKFDPEQREILPPELELILSCARTRLDETQAEHIRSILSGNLTWGEVMAAAVEHHAEPLLYENLKVAGEELVPPVWMDTFRQSALKTAGSSLLYFSELLRILEIFEAEQLPLIPYKGPVLSWLAYGSLTRRRFVDLDFFIEQQHIPRATALLKSAGFRADFGPREEQAGRTGYAPGQYGFSRNGPQLQIELHTERTLRYFPTPLDFGKMSGRLLTIELGGRKLRTFSIEDTLVMLCVHGTKHFWERLSWIADVAGLIATQPVDWPLAMRIAAKLKSTRLLLLGLYLAHDPLEAPLPQPILDRARQDPNVRWLAKQVRQQFDGIANPSVGVWPRAVFRVRSGDRFWQGMRHMVRLAIHPTEKDLLAVRLPRGLAPLYVLVRPWRLLRENGVGFERRSGPVRESCPANPKSTAGLTTSGPNTNRRTGR